ncbi:divalent-cation tolerance protein CutA [Solirubrobacter sp. CPCC 204708]|uniref:Divalent-cation tolerance protein CutA n=1 Tax=Solirubrobacter deserti TaxID=2282478 RepID=A0ABT4RD27_9ACTN|nr:divalent-cation tolerance protein CutA [Solirubrobacter deserti]MBE2317812.1 divalent-cation tolerance protein CutA [Solirubrobacter deserti]MDA0136411.1 divalent-cation tolerance protein CutA [Solirubrobacter deserti]
MTHDLCEVIVTAPDPEWLTDLCRDLVTAGLASSAHVVHPVTSIYRWKGEVHQANEARAFLRTRQALVAAIVEFVVPRHPYEVPNVTALPVIAGNSPYLAWIRSETRSALDARESRTSLEP